MSAEISQSEIGQITSDASLAKIHREPIQFVQDGKVIDASRLISALREAFGDIKAVIQGNDWNSGAGHR